MPVALTTATSMSGQTRPGSAFAKGNLHAWAYEEYDAVTRTAAERAQVLKKLGITRAGFVGRNVTRMNEFDAYVTAYREHQIELVAVWTPVDTDAPLEEPHIKMFLEGVDRHRLKIQWWVTLEQFERVPEAGRVDAAVGLLRTLHAEATKKGLQLAVYGHGRDAWYTQPENEIAIVEKLAAPPDPARVGIAYNFHHAHSQLDRFATVLPKLVPHLIAVNLNGMRAQGPMILPIGDGDREQEMVGLLHRAGTGAPLASSRTHAQWMRRSCSSATWQACGRFSPPSVIRSAHPATRRFNDRHRRRRVMKGTFLASQDIERTRLDWGELAWISRPAETGSSRLPWCSSDWTRDTATIFTCIPGRRRSCTCCPARSSNGSREKGACSAPGTRVRRRGVVHASFNSGRRPPRFWSFCPPASAMRATNPRKLRIGNPGIASVTRDWVTDSWAAAPR